MSRPAPALPEVAPAPTPQTVTAGGKRTVIVRLLVSLAIGVCMYQLLKGMGLDRIVPTAAERERLDLGALGLFGALWLVSVFLRTYRWVHLLRPIDPTVSATRTFGIGLLGYAALFAPMRLGELVRPVLIARDRKVGFVQAAGTVVAERIVDGVVLTVMLVAALALTAGTRVAPSPDTKLPVAMVPGIAAFALTLFLSAFAAMALFYFWRATMHRLVHKLVGLVSKPLAQFVTEQLERVSDSLGFLMSRQHGLAFLRDTLAYWAVSVAWVMVLLRGAGAEASYAQAAVVIGVLGLGTALPGPPGFYGTYQIGAQCGIALFFPALVSSTGVLFTFVSYFTQLGTALVSLAVGFWLLARTQPPSASQSAR